MPPTPPNFVSPGTQSPRGRGRGDMGSYRSSGRNRGRGNYRDRGRKMGNVSDRGKGSDNRSDRGRPRSSGRGRPRGSVRGSGTGRVSERGRGGCFVVRGRGKSNQQEEEDLEKAIVQSLLENKVTRKTNLKKKNNISTIHFGKSAKKQK